MSNRVSAIRNPEPPDPNIHLVTSEPGPVGSWSHYWLDPVRVCPDQVLVLVLCPDQSTRIEQEIYLTTMFLILILVTVGMMTTIIIIIID